MQLPGSGGKRANSPLPGLSDWASPECHVRFSDVIGVTSRAVLDQFPAAEELAHVGIRRLTRVLREAGRRRSTHEGPTSRGRRQELVR